MLIVSYQDFKERAISWWTLPLLLAFSFFLDNRGIKSTLIETGINMGFIFINLIVVTLYFSIKESKLVNIVNTKLGIGDILFFFSCCFIFSLPNFVLFFLFSLVFAVFLTLVARKLISNNSVPLAGIMASLLLMLSVINGLESIKLFKSNAWIETLLI